MKATTEIEIKVSGGRIVSANVTNNGICKLMLETTEEAKLREDALVLIEASKLSINDEFMQHEPKTSNERKFKELLSEVITRGVKDFYRLKFDPTFTESGNSIRYIPSVEPAVGKSYN